ncbi:DUF349 domain-containing protein [Thiothrix eikelboomii]|uniref:DUF349 domain-containing protein n=1 Tax=Thiothrix eikelboomii TaxID=92487 RepID=UPI003BB1EB49
MLGSLFKPKWQHKDAKIRLQALTSLAPDSSELISLAENDPDDSVRRAAIERLNHLPCLIKLGKTSTAMSREAQARVQALIETDLSQDAALVEVFAWFKPQAHLLKALAQNPKRDVSLRKLALAEIRDQAVLLQIAEQAVSKDIQFQAASQISDLQTLQQLERSQGKTNKRLRQLLKERMDQAQQQQQRQSNLEKLCADLEALGQQGQWAQDKTRQRVLAQTWKQQTDLGEIPPALQQRFQAAEQDFAARLQAYEAEQAAQAPLQTNFEAYLHEARLLQNTIQQHPEQLTLETIDQTLLQLQERWVSAQRLPESLQASLDQRWVEQFVALTDARDAVASDLNALAALQACCQQAEALRTSERLLQAKRLTDLQSQWTQLKRPLHLREVVANLENRFHQALSSLTARLDKQVAQREQVLQQLQADLQQMEADLEAEKYGEAIDLHQKLSHALSEDLDLPAGELAKIKRRLQAATPLVLELKDWRRWGTDQAREHLIETAERLERNELMDPQVRAKEIKALREEWRKLGQMDPGRQHKQWKTFDSKVTAAYEVSKQYFAEQATQREAHLHDREAICAALEALQVDTAWEQADWSGVQAVINQQRQAWKACGTVGHKEWKQVNQRFNAAMDALDAELGAERTRNWAAREALVEQAKALLEQEDLVAATEQAKLLQAQWKITLAARPKEEQALWKQFRAPIDELFTRLKASRQTQRSETEQRIEQKEALCAEVEAMQTLNGEAFTQATKQLEGLRQRFNALRDLPKPIWQGLEERFQRAEKALQTKRLQLRWQAKLAELDQLATESLQHKLDFEDVALATMAQHQTEGENLCLQLEILMDVATPNAFRQARLHYQVAHMSESMRGLKESGDLRAQALQLLKAWYQLGAMPAEALTAQQARIEAVRRAVAG